MQSAIGIDLVHIPRLEKLIRRKPHFALRILQTDTTELTGTLIAHMAGKFAAKEASYKALSQAGHAMPSLWIWLQRTIIISGTQGPVLHCDIPTLHAAVSFVRISISHEREYAIAMAFYFRQIDKDIRKDA